MGMITAQRMTAALLGGSMSTAQLETLLGTAPGLAGWKLACATKSMTSPLIADATAKAAWTGSTKAMDAMAALSADGAAAMAADSAIMTNVFSVAARADHWFASANARAAIWGSDKALTALMNNPNGKARARACAKYTVKNMAGNGSEQTFLLPLGAVGAKFILIGWSCNAIGTVTISGRRADSVVGEPVFYGAGGGTAAIDNVMALLGPVKSNVASGVMGYFGVVEV